MILHALIVLKWECSLTCSRHKKCWEWGTRTRMRFMSLWFPISRARCSASRITPQLHQCIHSRHVSDVCRLFLFTHTVYSAAIWNLLQVAARQTDRESSCCSESSVNWMSRRWVKHHLQVCTAVKRCCDGNLFARSRWFQQIVPAPAHESDGCPSGGQQYMISWGMWGWNVFIPS